MIVRKSKKTCLVAECNNPRITNRRGYCQAHSNQTKTKSGVLVEDLTHGGWAHGAALSALIQTINKCAEADKLLEVLQQAVDILQRTQQQVVKRQVQKKKKKKKKKKPDAADVPPADGANDVPEAKEQEADAERVLLRVEMPKQARVLPPLFPCSPVSSFLPLRFEVGVSLSVLSPHQIVVFLSIR